MFKRVSVSLGSSLIRERNPVIYDIRDAASYENAHLPNAIFLSDQTLKSAIRKGVRERPVLIYCYRGNASQDIAKLFCDFGFSDVYSLDGGFESWKQEMGLAITSQAAPPETGVADWLKAQGYDPSNLNELIQGKPPLVKASQLGRDDLAAALIAAGALLTGVDEFGNDALWAACFSGDLKTVQVLLDAGSEIDRINPNGSTALMYAASAGKTEVVEFLLKAGANPNLENQDGFTALDLAANLDTLKLLRAHSKRQS